MDGKYITQMDCRIHNIIIRGQWHNIFFKGCVLQLDAGNPEVTGGGGGVGYGEDS